jgi:hypothetical protein
LAHKKQWWSFFRLPIAALAVFYAPGLFNTAFETMIICILNRDWYGLAYFPLGMLAALSIIGLTVAFSWLTEIDADFHAIKTVGLNEFLDLHGQQPPLTFRFNSIVNLMTHPPLSATAALWRRLNFKTNGATTAPPSEPVVSQTIH